MMSRARVLLGSVFVLGLLVPALSGQTLRQHFLPPESSSHRHIGGGLDDMANPEAALTARLTSLSRMRQLQKEFGGKKLDGDLAKLAGKLLRDEKFLESLKGQVSHEDIERLQ